MGFEIRSATQGWVELQFDNVISLWNILKNLSRMPYLQSFIIEDYDGGNTQIDREYWNQEQIMFKELAPGKFFFPYESIGFILDDSISDVTISVLGEIHPTNPSQSKPEYTISIRDTDTCTVRLPDRDAVPVLAALYLFSKTDSGFDQTMLFNLKEGMRGILKDKEMRFEIVDGTFKVTMEALNFVLRLIDSQGKESLLHIQSGKRFHKKAINESQIKNLAYLKKKWLANLPLYRRLKPFFEKHPLLSVFLKILLWIMVLGLLVVVLPKVLDISSKKVIPPVAAVFLAILGWKWLQRFLRRNVYKRYLKYQDQ